MTPFPDALRAVLAAQGPHANADAPTLLGEGWNAVAWRLPGPNGDWVVRVPKLDYARTEIERQTLLGPRLRARGFPVPDEWSILRHPDGSVAAGFYRYVEGEMAPRAGAPAPRALAPQVAAFLTRLHALAPEFALGCGAVNLPVWPGFYSTLVEQASSILGPKSAALVARLGRELGEALATAPAPVLVHGDLAPWHLICGPDGMIRAVLDFLGPFLTDPAIDFGRLVQHWGVEFAESVLAAYGGEIDAAFGTRMRLYASLEPLKTVRAGIERGQPQWVAWGRRRLAARAAADSRRR